MNRAKSLDLALQDASRSSGGQAPRESDPSPDRGLDVIAVAGPSVRGTLRAEKHGCNPGQTRAIGKRVGDAECLDEASEPWVRARGTPAGVVNAEKAEQSIERGQFGHDCGGAIEMNAKRNCASENGAGDDIETQQSGSPERGNMLMASSIDSGHIRGAS
ncbi:MAG: hypothetical protein M3Y22_06485 [Pseudomonadota bacterium]|nr:hypothetical protein [Pseudomonadota bacterium]